MNKRKVGEQWEIHATEYLKNKGYDIIEHNYRCRMGEIDIIAKEQEQLVFVEVKYRSGRTLGYSLEAITPAKQNTLCKVAAYYLTTVYKSQNIACRFDVIGFDTINGKVEISHIVNAF
ncbi:MAG: YraN family protein [Lachnospira sp.]|nr:YraN family protein [Lachnospira sp.]